MAKFIGPRCGELTIKNREPEVEARILRYLLTGNLPCNNNTLSEFKAIGSGQEPWGTQWHNRFVLMAHSPKPVIPPKAGTSPRALDSGFRRNDDTSLQFIASMLLNNFGLMGNLSVRPELVERPPLYGSTSSPRTVCGATHEQIVGLPTNGLQGCLRTDCRAAYERIAGLPTNGLQGCPLLQSC